MNFAYTGRCEFLHDQNKAALIYLVVVVEYQANVKLKSYSASF